MTQGDDVESIRSEESPVMLPHESVTNLNISLRDEKSFRGKSTVISENEQSYRKNKKPPPSLVFDDYDFNARVPTEFINRNPDENILKFHWHKYQHNKIS